MASSSVQALRLLHQSSSTTASLSIIKHYGIFINHLLAFKNMAKLRSYVAHGDQKPVQPSTPNVKCEGKVKYPVILTTPGSFGVQNKRDVPLCYLLDNDACFAMPPPPLPLLEAVVSNNTSEEEVRLTSHHSLLKSLSHSSSGEPLQGTHCRPRCRYHRRACHSRTRSNAVSKGRYQRAS